MLDLMKLICCVKPTFPLIPCICVFHIVPYYFLQSHSVQAHPFFAFISHVNMKHSWIFSLFPFFIIIICHVDLWTFQQCMNNRVPEDEINTYILFKWYKDNVCHDLFSQWNRALNEMMTTLCTMNKKRTKNKLEAQSIVHLLLIVHVDLGKAVHT